MVLFYVIWWKVFDCLIENKLGENLKTNLWKPKLFELELEPRAIPRIQENAEKDSYKMKENMVFFLEALAEYGLPRYKLFQPKSLWEGSG